MSGFFFKEEKQIQITGVLWTPYGNHPKPYPIVIYSHGSQDGGVEINVEPRATRLFLEKGYAVLYPLRKGFNRKGTPPSEVRAEVSEPIQCNNYGSSEEGLQSAIADVRVLYNILTTRTDIDLTKTTLMGISRGGFLSLALAAEELPGVRKVLNFSGGWYSERCYSGFNSMKFEYFGKKIKSPILSFYGDNDNYYSLDHIRSNLQALDKGGMNISHILPGGGHGLLFRNPEFWIPFVFPD
jgi:dienelactone hydrolase